jgi:cytochrome b
MPAWGYAAIGVFVLMLVWPSTGERAARWMRRARRKARSRRRARREARALRDARPPLRSPGDRP